MASRTILISDPSRVKDPATRAILEEIKLINDTKEKAVKDLGTASVDLADVVNKLNSLLSILRGE